MSSDLADLLYFGVVALVFFAVGAYFGPRKISVRVPRVVYGIGLIILLFTFAFMPIMLPYVVATLQEGRSLW